MPWKKISSNSVYKDKWMELTKDEVLTPLGTDGMYSVVHKVPFVMVIPWDGKHFTLVGQHRYPADVFSWEFPAGHFEHTSLEETAKRELEEEAGLRSEHLVKIGQFNLAPGQCKWVGHVFLATNLEDGVVDREESEADMEVKKVSMNEFEEMVSSGEITDGSTIVAYGLLKLKKLF